MDFKTLEKSKDLAIWDNEPSTKKYTLPLRASAAKSGEKLIDGIPENELYHFHGFLCALSPESHIGPYKHAIDFLVTDGSAVLAAAFGKIVEVSEEEHLWGDDPKYSDNLNYVTIKHAENEFSQYCHLAKGSVKNHGFKVGSWVEEGQAFAFVGKTGWTDRDHLHFVVFRNDSRIANPFGFKSLLPRFKN